MSAGGAAVWRQFATLRRQLARTDMSYRDKMTFAASRLLVMSRLSPTFRVARLAILELRDAPAGVGRLRDLEVRRAGVADLEGLCAVDQTPADLVRARLDQGSLAFVGAVGGRILCHVWFNSGPVPCSDHDITWPLEKGTFFSHNIAASPEAQGLGVLAQAFQNALVTLFAEQGARRVGCVVCPENLAALRLRLHVGFHRVGTVTSLTVPGALIARWSCGGTRKHWIGRRGQEPRIDLPPMSMPGPSRLITHT